ncbi:MAG: tyrosine-type recombinase/integrase [Chloroflexi bacterium]|nr:tyrosine-type recombinase/integrase [Chloroflexota bacterium]
MKTHQPTQLGQGVVRFFQEYLPSLRGMSPHTLRSYRDALVLLLRFVAQNAHRPIEVLDVPDLSTERVIRFLQFLETERHNGIATRNARLAAIHTFARFLAAERPEHLGMLQRILGIPFKRGAKEAPIEYLESSEVQALLNSIDRSSPLGRRDYTLVALMFNTGARVQEILNLRVRDLRLDPPCQVRLCGKGRKVRFCPIWPGTAQLLQQLIEGQRITGPEQADTPLFTNRQGTPLTRFGVRYLLRKYLASSCVTVSTIQGKRLHPHSLRHTTAIHLLKAGVDFATISQWLGHATLNTTMRYARADIDLKRQALTQVFPDTLAPPRTQDISPDGVDIEDWLRRL